MYKKESPLKKLVDAHEELNLPVKVTPTKRVAPGEEIVLSTESAEELNELATQAPEAGLAINNSSLVVNINLNLDSKAIDRAVEQSTKIAKGLAAGAAAMLGTAFIFSGKEKRVGKVRLPLMPKIKVPRITE